MKTTTQFLTLVESGTGVSDALGKVASSVSDVLGILKDLDGEAYDCVRDSEDGIDVIELLSCVVGA